MKAYFRAFINYEQDNWAKFLFIAKFAYNNVKNTSIGYMSFKINGGYHPHVFYKEDIDLYFKSKVADELTKKLKNLITICKENL